MHVWLVMNFNKSNKLMRCITMSDLSKAELHVKVATSDMLTETNDLGFGVTMIKAWEKEDPTDYEIWYIDRQEVL